MRKPVTKEQAQQIDLAKQAAQVPAAVRRTIALEALASQQVDLSKYYYSRIRFQADEYDDGMLVFNPGDRYAFSYQIRQEVDGHPGHAATYADTNLLEERSTNSGEQVKIVGMAIRPTPTTDALLMNAMDMFIQTSLRLDNRELVWLGNPSDVPGSSQNAKGPTWLQPPPLDATVPDLIHPTLKGWPTQGNYLPFGQPIIWNPGDQADSKLDVLFRLNETFRFQAAPARVENNDPATAASGVTEWNPPEDLGKPGTFVDFFVKLYVKSIGPRSQNR